MHVLSMENSLGQIKLYFKKKRNEIFEKQDTISYSLKDLVSIFRTSRMLGISRKGDSPKTLCTLCLESENC